MTELNILSTKFKNFLRIKKKHIVAIVLLEFVALMVLMIDATGVFAAKEYWIIKAGDKTLSTMNSEVKAKEAVQLLKEKYTIDGAKKVEVKFDPVVTVEKQFYAKGQQKPKVEEPENFVKRVAKEGSDIKITVNQTVEKIEDISYKTVYKDSDVAALNTEIISEPGKAGKKSTKINSTSVNGDEIESKIVDTKITEEAKNKIVLKGKMLKPGVLGDTTTHLGAEYSKNSGENLVVFAKQFLGNPYVYGGSSLTKGADCSGFVMALYNHYGISLPHNATAHRSYGKEVSLSEAQAGDLICFSGHVGIYIGNNQLIHAMDEAHGITISQIGYNGKPILTVRRIFG